MMNILDLFSGIGGFSLGLERTGGFRTVAFCEQDAYASAVLRKHWPDVPVYPDVRSLGAERLAADGVPSPDLVCGGFPCQDISTAGKGAGLSGARSGLWFEFLRIIGETRPRWAVIENVSALRNRGLDTVLRGLASIGYDAEWHCIPAAAVGAPHRRDRVWVVAYAERGQGGERSNIDMQWRWSGEAQQARLGGGRANAAHASVVQRDGGELPAGSGREGAYPAADVAYPNGDDGRPGREGRLDPGGPGQPVAERSLRDVNGAGLAQREGERSDARPKLTAIERADWWLVEPGLGEPFDGLSGYLDHYLRHAAANNPWRHGWERGTPRVAIGVPRRVDRLRCLGNAVVPQIPELIGRAILAAETT